MEISEALILKASLEDKLREFTYGIVDEFQNRTGLKVQGVDIELAAYKVIAMPERNVVMRAKLDVRLEHTMVQIAENRR